MAGPDENRILALKRRRTTGFALIMVSGVLQVAGVILVFVALDHHVGTGLGWSVAAVYVFGVLLMIAGAIPYGDAKQKLRDVDPNDRSGLQAAKSAHRLGTFFVVLGTIALALGVLSALLALVALLPGVEIGASTMWFASAIHGGVGLAMLAIGLPLRRIPLDQLNPWGSV